MGTQRTSNKDIAEKLDTLIGLLVAQAQDAAPQVQEPAPVITPVITAPTPTKAEPETPRIEKKYMAHMEAKVAGLVAADGQPRVLYARRNGHGEHKLAYCLHSRWANLKDNGFLGALRMFDGK